MSDRGRGPSPALLEVVEPGLMTTIQDRGRFGHEAEGVSRCGAADATGLAIANLVIGNRPDAAAIECTLLGPRLRALVDTTIGLGGADLGARIEATGEHLAPGSSHRLRAGDVLAFDGPGDSAAVGCRAYVAVPGGIDVPVVLGSRSTCLPAGFGGFDGRPLRPGDRLAGGAPRPGLGGSATTAARASVRLPARLASELPSPAQRIRVLPGPAAGEGDATCGGIVGRPWLVASESDRRGLRLEPAGSDPSRDLAPTAAGELPSHGVVPGAIQVTPSGQPLVLMPDAGTTGGYPVLAIVTQSDLPLLGQLAPGHEVRFRRATAAEARDAELARRDWIARATRALAESVSSA